MNAASTCPYAGPALSTSRLPAGADSIATTEQKIAALQKQIDAYRELSSSLAFD